MTMGDGEVAVVTMRDDREDAAVSAEREYVQQISRQEQRIEAAWRWTHRVHCRSFV